MPPAAIWVTIRYRPAIKLPGAVINTSSTAHIETSSTIECADGRRTLGRSHRAGARNMPPRHPVAPWDSILADRPHPTTPDRSPPAESKDNHGKLLRHRLDRLWSFAFIAYLMVFGRCSFHSMFGRSGEEGQ